MSEDVNEEKDFMDVPLRVHDRRMGAPEKHLWQQLLTEFVRHKGQPFCIPLEVFSKEHSYCIRTISTILHAFEKEGIISIKIRVGRAEKGNTYTINWERACAVFGIRLFFDCERNVRVFCRNHVPYVKRFIHDQNMSVKVFENEYEDVMYERERERFFKREKEAKIKKFY